MRFRFIECGHEIVRIPNNMKNRVTCRVCNPSKFCWPTALKTQVNLRSTVEKDFVQFLVARLGVKPTAIDYEAVRIPYVNPRTEKTSVFIPDFIVKGKHVFEVKDAKSLGLKRIADDRIMFADKNGKSLLLENRAKARAALQEVSHFQFVVKVSDRFIRIPNPIWKLPMKQLRKELLRICF
jgi:hypothetical protein